MGGADGYAARSAWIVRHTLTKEIRMRLLITLTLPAILLLSVGCAKRSPVTAADYYSSPDYQERDLLEQSLFRSDQEVMSGEEIRRILESRIQVPASSHLAMLRVGSRSEILAWSLFGSSTLSPSPFQSLSTSPRVERISWLPSLLVPEKITVPLLREAAARYQADLLLVFRAPCQDFRDYRWLRADKARTYCAAEAVLLDVRTGIIPFSSSALEALEVLQTESDVSLYESTQRAEAQASTKALSHVASDVAEFLNALQ